MDWSVSAEETIVWCISTDTQVKLSLALIHLDVLCPLRHMDNISSLLTVEEELFPTLLHIAWVSWNINFQAASATIYGSFTWISVHLQMPQHHMVPGRQQAQFWLQSEIYFPQKFLRPTVILQNFLAWWNGW